LFQRFRKNSLTSEKKEQSLVPGEVEELFIGSTVRWRKKRIHRFQGKSKKEEDSAAAPGVVEERRGFNGSREVEERRGLTGSRRSRRKKRIHRFQGKSKKEEDFSDSRGIRRKKRTPVPGEVEDRRGFVSEKIEEWCVEKVEKDVSKALYPKVSRQGQNGKILYSRQYYIHKETF
jgi:hypothetical protein